MNVKVRKATETGKMAPADGDRGAAGGDRGKWRQPVNRRWPGGVGQPMAGVPAIMAAMLASAADLTR